MDRMNGSPMGFSSLPIIGCVHAETQLQSRADCLELSLISHCSARGGTTATCSLLPRVRACWLPAGSSVAPPTARRPEITMAGAWKSTLQHRSAEEYRAALRQEYARLRQLREEELKQRSAATVGGVARHDEHGAPPTARPGGWKMWHSNDVPEDPHVPGMTAEEKFTCATHTAARAARASPIQLAHCVVCSAALCVGAGSIWLAGLCGRPSSRRRRSPPSASRYT